MAEQNSSRDEHADDIEAVYSISAVIVENGEEKFYNAGSVVIYRNHPGKMRLNHIPGQVYRLYDKSRRDRG